MVDLSGLNREQLEAVVTTEGPLLVLAGAGSGKTRVITYRLANLVQKGVPPSNILCVTFTNKAALEMRERARKLVGQSVRSTTISTFHALGSKILRAYPSVVGLRNGFTITDSADQIGTLKRLQRNLHIDDRKYDSKRIMSLISQAKNAGIDPDTFRQLEGVIPSLPESAQENEDYQLATVELYARYENALKAQNIVDFDDLLLLTLQLLKKAEDIRAKLQNRWRYIMVDEYQDTNGAQLELIRVLAGPKKNLCVVGDDDQSIYGWRGADVSNILNFEKHFPGAKRVMLLTNYRSTGNILSVANAVIEKNEGRYDKRLKAATHDGKQVRVCQVEDEDAEAEHVSSAIVGLTESGVMAGNIAILYRSNTQSRNIELSLRSAQVPYRVVGGMELFDRREVKDFIAYLRFLHNPDDEQSLRRIINWPPRGIGDTTLRKIDDWARKQDMTLSDVLKNMTSTLELSWVPNLSAKGIAAIADFWDMLTKHRTLLKKRKASTVVKRLLEATGIENTLLNGAEDTATAQRRIENVKAVVRQLERYEQRIKRDVKKADLAARIQEAQQEDNKQESEDELDDFLMDEDVGSLEGFLADLALTGFGESKSQEDKNDQVVLSTIHASKGLEWSYVYLVGIEEELLPHKRTLEDHRELSEERRLAYVAVTRAKSELVMTWAKHRTRYGQIVDRVRSRFLEDLPSDSVVFLEDQVLPPKTEAEEKEIAKDWMAKIRADLEAKRTLPKQDGA